MRKLLLIVFVFWASITFGQYYDSAEGLKETALKTALFNIINGHTAQSYTPGVWDAFYTTDEKANGFVWDMYSDVPGGTPDYDWTFGTDQCGNYSGEGSCYNREHSFPQSWFNEASPMVTDLFHIYPTDGYVNGKRSNFPFGEVTSPTWTSTNDSKLGPNTTAGYSGTVFEPIDEYKGDFARSYFYMATRYEDILTGWDSPDVLDGSTYQVYVQWHLDLLLSWHAGDPVSTKETERNDAVYAIQNNRNPFIDHPELVDYIWGTSFGSIWTSAAITTSPNDGDTDVAISSTITYTYSEAIRNIDNSEITDANVDALIALKLTNSSGANVGFDATIDVDKKVITVTPTADLANSQLYYASVDAVEDASDNAFAFTEIDFTTIEADITAPTYTSSPTNGATNVAISTDITFTFNEAIRHLNDSEITDANVASLLILKETNASGANVAFTATIDANKEIITINPDADLSYDQVYYVAIASVEDASDNASTPSAFSFTTVFSATVTPLPYTQAFAADLGNCSTYNVSGAAKEWVWTSAYASMNGYNTGDLEEDWLILPAINFDNYSNETMTFDSWWKYGTDDANNYLKLIYSIDYSGTGDPSGASWTELSYTQGASEVWTSSGTIDLSSITGTAVYIAFIYHYNSGSYKSWGIDNISISEVADNTAPTLTTDPANNATSVAITTDIALTFNEAIRNLNDSDITDANVASLLTLKETDAGGSDVTFTATIDVNKEIITLNPSADFANDQLYYVAIASVEDASDNATSIESITFTTGATAAEEPGIGDLVITEVSGDGVNGTSDDGFMEIYNRTATELSLANVSARYYNLNPGASSQTVALSGTIAAGEFIIVTQNGANFQSEYGFAADFAGSEFYFNGSDDGVDLYHSTLGILDQFNEVGVGTTPWTWSDGSVWERTSSGSGAIKTNWTEYAVGTGTPKYLLSVSWTGSTDGTWITAGNWDKIIPGAYQNITIPTGLSNYPTVSATANCYDLEIAAGAELTIGGTLTAGGDIAIQSDATSSGSLIVGGTLNGNVTYKRYMTGVDKWHLTAAPIVGQGISSLVTTGTNAIATNDTKYGLAPYNNTTPAWDHYTTSTVGSAGNFTAGKGYEVLRTSAGTIDYTGTVATTDVSIGITVGAGNAWNLIGNPFPSAIYGNDDAHSTDNFITVNTSALDDAYEAIYVWDAASSAYLTVNQDYGAFYLAPGQGFFVYSVGATSVNFTEAMQTHQTGDIFKSEETNTPTIKLIAKSSEKTTTTNIKYLDGMTIDLDPGYDAGRISIGDNSFAVYTHLLGDTENTIDFDIQCLPTNDFENMVIPVGLNAPINSEVIIEAELSEFPADLYVYIEDRELDIFARLDENDSKYTVNTTNEISGVGRFFIHTVHQELTSINEASAEEIYRIIPQPGINTLQIRGLVDEATKLSVYNLAGQFIAEYSLNRGEANAVELPPIKRGIYMVVIQSQSQSKSIKFMWNRY